MKPAAHSSIVKQAAMNPRIYISYPSFMETIKGKAALMGQRIEVRYAEGFVSCKTPGIFYTKPYMSSLQRQR